MTINVTEEQKRLIESQGYMVVQFKKWCKDVEPFIRKFCSMWVDNIKMIIAFLQEMALKISKCIETMIDFGKNILDKFKLDKEIIPEESEKYPFVRSLEREYRPSISNKVVYHRCRDRC